MKNDPTLTLERALKALSLTANSLRAAKLEIYADRVDAALADCLNFYVAQKRDEINAHIRGKPE